MTYIPDSNKVFTAFKTLPKIISNKEKEYKTKGISFEHIKSSCKFIISQEEWINAAILKELDISHIDK